MRRGGASAEQTRSGDRPSRGVGATGPRTPSPPTPWPCEQRADMIEIDLHRTRGTVRSSSSPTTRSSKALRRPEGRSAERDPRSWRSTRSRRRGRGRARPHPGRRVLDQLRRPRSPSTSSSSSPRRAAPTTSGLEGHRPWAAVTRAGPRSSGRSSPPFYDPILRTPPRGRARRRAWRRSWCPAAIRSAGHERARRRSAPRPLNPELP